MVFGTSVFAGPTVIYGKDFDLPILDKPASGSSMIEAIIKVPDHLTIYDLYVSDLHYQAEIRFVDSLSSFLIPLKSREVFDCVSVWQAEVKSFNA